MPKTQTRVDNPGPERSTRILQKPAFSQPQPTPDPNTFKVTHPSDGEAYKVIDELNKE